MENLTLTTPVSNLSPNSVPTHMKISNQIGITILVLAFVLGFPGNLFVVWSVLFRVQQRSVTCLLVLNLAVADAFVLLSAPLFLRLLAGGEGWEFGEVMCKTVHYLCCVNMYVSIYLICLMSLDRWLAVTRPFLSQRLRNKRTIYLAMLIIWILAFLLALPMPFFRSVITIKVINKPLCMIFHGEMEHSVFQYLFETLLGFVIPFTLILGFYSSVILRLRSAMFHGRVRGSLLILLIIITFTIFWLPYHLINITEVIGLTSNSTSLLNKMKVIRPSVTAFAFLSSSVNPILYVFAGSSHIRRAGLGFMANLFEGTHSDQAFSRRGTSSDHSILNRLTLKSVRNGDKPRNQSTGEEVKGVGYKEQIKTLTTVE